MANSYNTMPKYLKFSCYNSLTMVKSARFFSSVKGVCHSSTNNLIHVGNETKHSNVENATQNYNTYKNCQKNFHNNNTEKLNVLYPLINSSMPLSMRPSSICLHNPQHAHGFHSTAARQDIYIINNEEEFEQKVMGSSLPVVINFHADWCEPCHALKPLLENLAENFKGKMHLAEVKVDDHVQLLQAFEVTAVPAVVGIVRGQVKEKFVGLISEPEVRAFIDAMIGE